MQSAPDIPPQVAMSPVVVLSSASGCFVKISVEKELEEDLALIAFMYFLLGSLVQISRAI
jgi:hypothetical protein